MTNRNPQLVDGYLVFCATQQHAKSDLNSVLLIKERNGISLHQLSSSKISEERWVQKISNSVNLFYLKRRHFSSDVSAMFLFEYLRFKRHVTYFFYDFPRVG